MTPHILIATAVEGEASPIINHLKDPQALSIGGRCALSGSFEGRSVRLLITGPGQVNMVQSLTAAIERERPALIIQAGCAGAFPLSGLGIGDIGIADEEIDAHLGIESESSTVLPEPLPFAMVKKKEKALTNRYPLDSERTSVAGDILRSFLSEKGVTVAVGPFITVSTITATDSRAQQYETAYSPLMESMEGAGAAHVAIHYRIPLIEIRSASNIVGKRDRQSWNLPLAYERSALSVLALLKGNILKWIVD